MRLLAVCSLVALVGCSSLVAVNDKTEGTVPRVFIAEGRVPAQSSDEMAEYLVRRFKDSHATVRVIPYTAPLVAKMEREMGIAGELALPPKDRCLYVEVVSQESQAAELENLALVAVLPGGKRVPLAPLADSRERNVRTDWLATGRSQPFFDDGRPLRAREAALTELESKELRCAEETLAWDQGFLVEVSRLYDPGLPKQWLRWSVPRVYSGAPPKAREAATIEPLGVVKRSKIR